MQCLRGHVKLLFDQKSDREKTQPAVVICYVLLAILSSRAGARGSLYHDVISDNSRRFAHAAWAECTANKDPRLQ